MSRHPLALIASVVLAAATLVGAANQPSAEELARMQAAAPDRPAAKPAKPRKVLVVSECKGFVHSSIPYGEKAFEILGRKSGAFTTTVVQDMSILERPEFDTFDAIIMNNTTMRLPLLAIDTAGMDDAQKQAAEARETAARKRFLDFVRNGKGIVGVHAATDCLYAWPEYGELMGGYFDGHPWNETVAVKLDDPGHPLLRAFHGQGFEVADEIYQFRDPYSRKALRVLLSIDVAHTNMDKKGLKREDKDWAISWIRAYGKGRVFFFSLGHRHEIFWNPPILQAYLDGIQYALGDLPADDTPSAQLSEDYLAKSRVSAFATGLTAACKELRGYRLSENDRIAEQLDAMVIEHQSTADRAAREEISKQLAAVAADASATSDGRAFACRELSLVGTDAAVPALVGLIADPELGNWARYALARMPGETVDRALTQALGGVTGDARIGVIELLGQRGAAEVSPLVGLLRGNESEAVAAAEALGRITGAQAVGMLSQARDAAGGAVAAAIDRALLACGEAARAAGDKRTAEAAYAKVASDQTAAHVRAAAFRGRAMLAGESALPGVIDALRGGDVERARSAAAVVRELPGTGIAAAVAGALQGMPVLSQMLAVDALAARGDRAAQDGVLALIGSDDTGVKSAALRALEFLGDGRAVMALIAAASDAAAEGAVRDTARRSLYRMNAPGVDAVIAKALADAPDAKTKTEYVKVLGVRKAHDAFAAVCAAARSSDRELAKEARKAVGELARPGDLPEVVTLLVESPAGGAQSQLESILVVVARRADTDAARTTAIREALGRAMPAEARCSLLEALAKIGAPSGLAALTAAVKDADATVSRAAIRALADRWPDAAPIQVLREMSREGKDEGSRVLALRGYARMLAMPSRRPMKETLGLYREALDMARGDQEKRALIGGLGDLAHPDALAFVKPFFTDPAVRAEALMAAVKINQNLNGAAMVLTASLGKDTVRNAIDGSDKTRWTTGKPMEGGEWFTIDLGYETDVREIYLDAGPEGHDQPRGYEVYVSLDGENWGKPVAKAGDPGTKAFTIKLEPQKYARYVKIVQTGKAGGNYWSINELKVNGRPDFSGNTPLDRAKWKVSANRSGGGDAPANAIDGDLNTRWGTGGAMRPGDWFQVDLGEVKTVHSIVMNAARSGGDYPREFRIYTSMDGNDWFGPVGAGKGSEALTTAAVLPTKARFVKIEQAGSHETNWWSIYDLRILGE